MELKIIIADDHSIICNGISIILKDHFEHIDIKGAQNFGKVIETLKTFEANVVLLDINIPGGNSTQMIKSIREVNSSVLIMIFSAFDESQYALRYIHAGADGFLSKEASVNEIIEAIVTLLRTGKFTSSELKAKIVESVLFEIPANPLEVLSNRELQVADLLAKGEGNLEIANILDIKMSTVSTYKSRIFEKLNVSNVVGMINTLQVYKN